MRKEENMLFAIFLHEMPIRFDVHTVPYDVLKCKRKPFSKGHKFTQNEISPI